MEDKVYVNSINDSQMRISSYGQTKTPEMNFDTADIVFALVAIVLGFLYWNFIDLYMLGAGVTIFALLMFAASFVYLNKSGFKQNAKSLVCLTLATASAIQLTLFDNQFISFLNFIFLKLTFIYWICLSTGRQLEKNLSVYVIGDAFKQILSIPFSNFGCCKSGIAKGLSKPKKAKGVTAAFVGLLIFFPLIVVVINLLMSADLAFENFVIGFLNRFDMARVFQYILYFLFGIPVAFYLYGLIYGNKTGRYSEKITAQSVDNTAKSVKIAPRVTIYTVMTAFNFIYFVFFAVQANYLFSAFFGTLPQAFTYAEFARRGFFELCAVAGINLGILIIAHLAIKRESGEELKALRIQTVIISIFTILMIVTAQSKMIMYINVFGLTQLRVFTSWFMILLFLIFTFILVRQFKKFNLTRFVVIGFVAMFMALSYSNVDGLIAKYNIERYQAGTLQTLDIDALGRLSDAAVPHMHNLYITGEYDWRLVNAMSTFRWIPSESDFRTFNLQRHRANEIRARL